MELNRPRVQTSHDDNGFATTSIEVTPRASVEETQAKLKKRVKKQLKKSDNQLCVDCSKAEPKWATILTVPTAHGESHNPYTETFLVGGLCCLECSGAHRRMGTHIAFVRSVQLDTLKQSEVEALECGGNDTVNSIFEDNIMSTIKKLTPESSQKEREEYIRNKYEKKRYLNIKGLAQFRQAQIRRMKNDEVCSPLSMCSTPSMTSPANATPQLQIFTSSPRTLALIEKYMNPKPKKKGISRMKFSFKKLSRRRHMKGDIRNVRGIASLNPNVVDVETRSECGPSPKHDIDDGNESVTSVRSSNSALIRRKFLRGRKVSTPTIHDLAHGDTNINSVSSRESHATPRRKKFFFGKSSTPKYDEGTGMNEKDALLVEKKHIYNPSPASSTGTDSSLKSRMSRLTPKRKFKNKLNSNKGKSGKIFFADDRNLDVVNESETKMDKEDEEMKALKVWSKKIDRAMAKIFSKKRNKTVKHSNSDERTLLQELSNDS
ncbi:hypothetical protein CTEN210_14673 [Chaetoceros tenuissimus]|uniref:Arf-GAP domain-containing protein n=1 Tax=Chaetoceros tenuissimus TaxID=426638 RepID=A0AAD3D5B1_9STRA|nr:hypothetical protein CTEN210_14673 [Chaetoceros tenuissimus]